MRRSLTRPLFQVVTSIPSPYRVHEFGVLARTFAKRDVDMHVEFMAPTTSGRNWLMDPKDWAFPWSMSRGWRTHIDPRTPVYLAAGVWWRARSRRPQWLVLGGAWYQPSVVALAMSGVRDATRLLWVEASVEAAGAGRADRWRRTIEGRMDGFVVPGRRSKDVVQARTHHDSRPTLTLRNFVDERLYGDRVAALRGDRARIRERWELPSDRPVMFVPARLVRDKGIGELLEVLAEFDDRLSVVIAGDGPERGTFANTAEARGIRNARLVGHLQQDELLELYAASDALVLPSLREPYGFVAVEALWAQLPLILSSRVGAMPEVLEEGANGWCIDPTSSESIARALREAVAAGVDGLRTMGARSGEIAATRFGSADVAEDFVSQVTTRFPVAAAD